MVWNPHIVYIAPHIQQFRLGRHLITGVVDGLIHLPTDVFLTHGDAKVRVCFNPHIRVFPIILIIKCKDCDEHIIIHLNTI